MISRAKRWIHKHRKKRKRYIHDQIGDKHKGELTTRNQRRVVSHNGRLHRQSVLSKGNSKNNSLYDAVWGGGEKSINEKRERLKFCDLQNQRGSRGGGGLHEKLMRVSVYRLSKQRQTRKTQKRFFLKKSDRSRLAVEGIQKGGRGTDEKQRPPKRSESDNLQGDPRVEVGPVPKRNGRRRKDENEGRVPS